MSAVNHTDGEWVAMIDPADDRLKVITHNGCSAICRINPVMEAAEANARLIAAAPALLKALQAVINGLPSRESSARGHSPGSFHFVGYLGTKKLDMIEAAITKALLTVPMPPAGRDEVFNAEAHQ